MVFLKLQKSLNSNKDWPQILIIMIVCLGPFNIGTLFAWTSPSIPILLSNSSYMEPLTQSEVSYLTMLSPIGVLIPLPLISGIGKFFGNKNLIIVQSVPVVISWLLVIFAKSAWELYISRVLSGIGEAFLYAAVPAYVGEISTPHVRGIWGNGISLFFYVGHLFVNIVGSYCDILTTAYVCIWIPIFAALLTCFIPEAPQHYLKKGQIEKARNCLQIIRWNKNVDEELNIIKTNVVDQKIGTCKDVFLISKNLRGVIIALLTRGFQPLSGYAAIVFYNQYIFEEADAKLSASTSAIIYTGLQVICIIIFFFFSEKMGRRRSLMFSALGCAIGVAIVAVYFYLDFNTELNVSSINWLPLLGLIVFVVSFSFGLCSIPTLMMSEVIPLTVKHQALCVVMALYAPLMILSTQLFHVLGSNFGMYAPFCFYAACNVLIIIVCYFFVPETKGKTLEQIQDDIDTLTSKNKKQIVS
ncbi:hypothetical protein FQA39_LY07602 [Lamprigera yunnana]|nr:hypothetical protein FQA39_LY07602 [Lamprigera yunnana]